MDLICVDMYNTLIASNKPHILAYNKAFKKNKLKKIPAKKIKEYFGLTGIEIVRNLFPNLNKNQIIKIVNDHDYFLLNETKKDLRPFKGVKRTLNILKKKYKLVLISNCKHKEVVAVLKQTKFNKNLFYGLIACDDVKRPKPYPDEIFKAEKLVHQKVNFLIGDSIYDIRAGKKARVKTIAVLTGNHTKAQLRKENPDYIFKNFNEVLKIL